LCGLVRQLQRPFLYLFPLAVGVVLVLVQLLVDLSSLPAAGIARHFVFAILISAGIAVVSAVLIVLLPKLLAKVFRRILVGVALYTLDRAVGRYYEPVQAMGIGARRGDIVIRLAVGSIGSVGVGDKFDVLNAATREKWGALEVIEVEAASCGCTVSDRMNVGFWHELEQRMERDPSPPAGVTFSRESPPGLLEFVRRLVRTWGV